VSSFGVETLLVVGFWMEREGEVGGGIYTL
jgi:hypothetical protein